MATLRQFRILFNKLNATYEPGDVVSGKIIIDTTKEKDVKGLYFIAKGSAYLRWFRDDPMLSDVSQGFTNSEEYFNFKHDILGTTESQSGHKIRYGYNEYTFSFTLPQKIPCSFEHPTGYVRYTMKVVMERPSKFNHECKTAFSVISPLNLNLHREKCLGIHDETHKNFKCLWWIGRGSFSLQIMVPSSGYVPGQIIVTTLEYSCTPNIPIKKLSTKLVRRVHFLASDETLTHKNILKKTRHSQPFPNRRITSEILIPPIPPSDLKYCKIMDIDYELVVSIHVSRPYSRIKRTYPLLIGTVPLHRPTLTLPHRVVPTSTMPCRAQPDVKPTPTLEQGESSTSNIPQQEQANILPGPLDIPPPSYKEGCSKTPNIRDVNESEFIFGVNTPFSPKYPVFDYPAPRLPGEKL